MTKPRIFTLEEIELMSSLYREGHTTTEIGKLLKADRKKIAKVLREYGVQIRRKGPEFHFDWNLIQSLIEEGLNLKEIAERCGCDPRALSYQGIEKLMTNPNRLCTYNKDFDFFTEIDSETKAYFLGLLLADGSLLTNGTLRLDLKKEDKYMIENLCKYLSPETPVADYFKKKTGKWYSYACFKSKTWLNILPKYGLVPNKTREGNTSAQFPILESSLMPHLIRGYFDGNGCISDAVSFHGPKNYVEAIELYLKSIDLINTKSKTYLNKSNCFTFRFKGKSDLIKFYQYIYSSASIYLLRKKVKFDSTFSPIKTK